MLQHFLAEAETIRASEIDMDDIMKMLNKYFNISDWKIMSKLGEIVAEPSMIELTNPKEVFEYLKVLARNTVYAKERI